jgi:hypothetical protein
MTELIVMMPVNSLAALPRYTEMERRICELAAEGLYDDQIVSDFGRRGSSFTVARYCGPAEYRSRYPASAWHQGGPKANPASRESVAVTAITLGSAPG